MFNLQSGSKGLIWMWNASGLNETLTTEKILHNIFVAVKEFLLNENQPAWFQKFLLSGPEITDEQFNYLQEKRNQFKEWK